MIYLVCYSLTTFFAYKVSKINYDKNRFLVIALSMCCILIPTLLGGLRNITVGKDVQVYVIDYFQTATRFEHFGELIKFYNYREPFYHFLNYIVTRFTNDISVLFCLQQFITFSCIYTGAYKHRQIVPVWFVLILYFFLFYQSSLNLVRQYLAISIVFLGVSSLEKNKYFQFLLFTLIAAQFHFSAYLVILLIPIHYLATYKNRSYRNVFQTVIVVAAICCVVFLRDIVLWLISVGIVPHRYITYIEKGGSVGDNLTETLLYGLELIIIFLLYQHLKDTDNFEFYKINAILVFVALQLGKQFFYGDRYGYYFNIINLLMVARIPQFSKHKNERIICYLAITIIAFVYWYFIYIYSQSGQTFPYEFIR